MRYALMYVHRADVFDGVNSLDEVAWTVPEGWHVHSFVRDCWWDNPALVLLEKDREIKMTGHSTPGNEVPSSRSLRSELEKLRAACKSRDEDLWRYIEQVEARVRMLEGSPHD
jgi:hypothetical protein